MRRHWIAFAIGLALTASPAWARPVMVPLKFDVAFVRQALVKQIYTLPDEKASVFDDGVGCSWLDLYEPQVDVTAASLHIVSRGDARIGTKIAGQCLIALEWKGFVEMFQEPQLDATVRVLTFKVVDSNIYDEHHEKGLATGKLWDLVKTYAQPRFEALRIDLNQPFNEVRGLLPLILPGSQERLDALLASLTVRDPRMSDGGLKVTLTFEVEPRGSATAPAAEPTLSAAELAAWQTKWQQWDAFLTFVIKHVARDTSGVLRRAVLDVLLDARYELLDALAPPQSGAPDPVPELFVHAWEQLAPALRQASVGLPTETALQYASFIAASDALAALEDFGPKLGLEISADGLRRLARMVAPSGTEDPVAYSTDLDPELRTALGFGAPLPQPEIPTDVEMALQRLLIWFASPASAATELEVVGKLNRWAPTRDDIATYLPLVRELLKQLGEQQLAKGEIEARFADLYRHLIFATAWQESCWRQFVRVNGKLAPLKSTVGSIGLMQVNQNVWRGVYDLKGLAGDIRYNGRAGSEILFRYLRDYAIEKGEHEQPGGIDNLARATYAVYNGGPGHRTRYRAKKPKRALKKIDDLFYEKYKAVRDGREMDVASCYGE